MDTECVLWDVTDGVCTITFNRPERNNAQTPELERRFVALLRQADRDISVKAVIVTGAGRSFCPGGDVANLDAIAGGDGFDEQIPRVLARYGVAVRKPVVAAVNGACAGSGLVYALSSDVRYASSTAKFGTAFVRIGLAAERAMSWYLPRIVGLGAALDLLLSGRVIGAEEALELGLVSKVVEPDELMPVTVAWARDVARNCSPRSMAVIKAQTYRDTSIDLMQSIGESADSTFQLLSNPDLLEGVEAFRSRRPPEFAPLDPPPFSWDVPGGGS